MKRVLKFDPKDDKSVKRFSICWQAAMYGGQATEAKTRQTRSFDVQRREAKLMDALDVVSEPDPNDPNKTGLRRLSEAGGDVTMTAELFALLTEYIEVVGWLGIAVRDAVATRDWLPSAETIES